MNYTLKQLQDRVSRMIEEQGEDAECAAWIYTKNDCHLKDEDGNTDYGNNVEDPAMVARIFDDVGNIDYIYQVIQESVDEVVEEQLMQYQQEMVDSWGTGTRGVETTSHPVILYSYQRKPMLYRVIVPSARYEDQTTNDPDQAREWCYDMAQEFGYAEVRRNLCGPEPIIESYSASWATDHQRATTPSKPVILYSYQTNKDQW